MERKWVVYGIGPQPSKRKSFRVTLNAKGRLALNRFAYDEFGRPEAVELVIDEPHSAIGLRPVDAALPHAYRIGDLGRGRIFGFGCRQFLNDLCISTEQTTIFPTARIEDGVLILEPKYRVPATVRRRPSKGT
jgi:hypothetical protein